jgi:acyl-homoserine-lactone acylase
MNTIFPFVKKIALLLCCLTLIFDTAIAQTHKAEILWDNYGVPHIYGRSTAGMYYAFGWAQMHNHADLLLQLYGEARGRAAEYWGKQYLQSDEIIQKFNLGDISLKIYEEQHKEYKSYLDAFVSGVNAYAKAHPEVISEKYKQVLPVTATDVIAHTINVLDLTFVAGNNIYGAIRNVQAGSNALAVAASRSKSGHAMLMANPHLPWGGLYTFFEAHLTGPGFDAYGATLVGFPVLAIAFNDDLGWTHTVNPINASTCYELALKDTGYVLDGAVTPFEKKTVIIKIKQDTGMTQEQLVIKYSKQGPVISEKGKKAYAVRIAGLDNPYFNEQYHKMAKATNFLEFESAVKMMQMPMFNDIYADKAGNIMYLFGGNVPVMTAGDFQFWHNRVDGTSSRFIWTKTLPYEDLPKVFNPPSGFVQNANDAPWTCTFPTVLDPKKFPAYIAPFYTKYQGDYREQRAINMIRKNDSVTFEQVMGYKLNTGMETADRYLDDLLKAASKSPDTTIVKAAGVLSLWDRHSNADSKGTILWIQWCNDMHPDSIYKNDWQFDKPASTPNGLKNPPYAVKKLKQAANEVTKRFGALDVAWGDMNRFRSGDIDLPGNGAPSNYGSYRAVGYAFDDKDKKFRAAFGDSYVAITEFGKSVKAMVLLSYGNASQPGNKHVGDQFQLMTDRVLRTALLNRDDILKNLEEREDLSSK